MRKKRKSLLIVRASKQKYVIGLGVSVYYVTCL